MADVTPASPTKDELHRLGHPFDPKAPRMALIESLPAHLYHDILERTGLSRALTALGVDHDPAAPLVNLVRLAQDSGCTLR